MKSILSAGLGPMLAKYSLNASAILLESLIRLLHTMNVRFSLLDIAQRILGVTLLNFSEESQENADFEIFHLIGVQFKHSQYWLTE
jgi:hypothetical protein